MQPPYSTHVHNCSNKVLPGSPAAPPDATLAAAPAQSGEFAFTQSMIQHDCVAAVIVIFHPPEDFYDFVARFSSAVGRIIIVSNGAKSSDLAQLAALNSVDLVANACNVGLSKAMNQGCDRAFSDGYQAVILFDQDSRPDGDLPQRLAAGFNSAARTGMKIACVGPRLIDIKKPEARLGKFTTGEFQFAVSIASSGSLITYSAYCAVGRFLDDLFIDAIDHEWCMRADSKGWKCLIINTVSMDHNMGDYGLSIFGRFKPLHRSPIRHYYITRNTIWLLKMPYISVRFKFSEGLKLFYRIPFYLAASANRGDTVKSIYRALLDGMLNRAVS